MVNGDPKLFGIKPLQFIIDFKSDAFIEKAGNKYLFKVGELIGQQIQLYQVFQKIFYQGTLFIKVKFCYDLGFKLQ